MNERQENLLQNIISEFYESAQPVGSSLLVNKYYADLSSATIRNEMAELEKDGFIVQPHTSAGRIPTQKGYQYYIDNLLQEINLSASKRKNIDQVINQTKESKESIKILAKTIAEITKEAVFVAFDKYDVYYTGISNILIKPEFCRQDLILNISKVIDHFDEVIPEIFDQIEEKVDILIGDQNPFSNTCATVVVKHNIFEQNQLIGILGPMRMDYATNKGILQYLKNI
jgi:transcriptional regulator of heat shock response